MIFRKVFYRLYIWANKREFDDSPEFTALFTISFLVFLNIITLHIYTKELSGLDFYFLQLAQNKLFTISIIILITILNYFFLVFRHDLTKEIKEDSAASNLVVIVYISISFIAFIIKV